MLNFDPLIHLTLDYIKPWSFSIIFAIKSLKSFLIQPDIEVLQKI